VPKLPVAYCGCQTKCSRLHIKYRQTAQGLAQHDCIGLAPESHKAATRESKAGQNAPGRARARIRRHWPENVEHTKIIL
jgi:hypothetical protein